MTARTNLVSPGFQELRLRRRILSGWTLAAATLLGVITIDTAFVWQQTSKLTPLVLSLRADAAPIREMIVQHESLKRQKKHLLERQTTINQSLHNDSALQTLGVLASVVAQTGPGATSLESLTILLPDGSVKSREVKVQLQARTVDDSASAALVTGLRSNKRLAEVTLRAATHDPATQQRLLEITAVPRTNQGDSRAP